MLDKAFGAIQYVGDFKVRRDDDTSDRLNRHYSPTFLVVSRKPSNTKSSQKPRKSDQKLTKIGSVVLLSS